MGVEDRDWYREAHKERDRKRMQDEATRWRFGQRARRPQRLSNSGAPTWVITLFWVFVALFVYALARYVRVRH
jgi:hypothetical protein